MTLHSIRKTSNNKLAGSIRGLLAVGILSMVFAGAQPMAAKSKGKLPVVEAAVTYAPEVPPPITRKKPAIVQVHLDS